MYILETVHNNHLILLCEEVFIVAVFSNALLGKPYCCACAPQVVRGTHQHAQLQHIVVMRDSYLVRTMGYFADTAVVNPCDLDRFASTLTCCCCCARQRCVCDLRTRQAAWHSCREYDLLGPPAPCWLHERSAAHPQPQRSLTVGAIQQQCCTVLTTYALRIPRCPTKLQTVMLECRCALSASAVRTFTITRRRVTPDDIQNGDAGTADIVRHYELDQASSACSISITPRN